MLVGLSATASACGTDVPPGASPVTTAATSLVTSPGGTGRASAAAPGTDPTAVTAPLAGTPTSSAPRPPCTPDERPTNRPPTDPAEDERTHAAQQEMYADFELLQGYAEAHGDQVAGVAWDNAVPGRIALYVVDDLEPHLDALAGVVDHPDRVVMRRGCSTSAELDVIQDAILSDRSLVDRMRSSSNDPIAGVVHLSLTADSAPIADDLLARYPGWLRLTVGNRPYPRGSRPSDRTFAPGYDPCSGWEPVPEETTVPGLEIAVTLERSTVVTGADLRGTARITNSGSAPVELGGRFMQFGVLVERGSRRVLAQWQGGVEDRGLGRTVEPGTATELEVRASTEPCAVDGPDLLPPGDYGLVVPITVGRSAADPMRRVAQWSTETIVTLVAPPG